MKYALLIFALISSTICFAQFDNEAFIFKRNSIRLGVGTQSANNFPVRYISNGVFQDSRDIELEYERQFNRYFSGGIVYKFVDYNIRVYQYREHQRQVNFFYAPFNNFRRIQFKLGAGLTHATIRETNNSSFELPGFSYTRSTRFDWGFIGIGELNYSVVKNISVGIKGYRQITYWNKSTSGLLLKLGYSF